MDCLNELLESLAKRLDSELMEKIVEMLPTVDLNMDERTYEVFLNMFFTTRSFKEVMSLASQMKAKEVSFTPRSAMAVIKTALKMNNLDEALVYFQKLKSTWSSSSPSAAPVNVISHLVELACKDHRLDDLLDVLKDTTVPEEVVNIMFSECIRQKDKTLTQKVDKF